MRPEKLHITFGVMCLPDDESHLRAQQILVDCLEKIVKLDLCPLNNNSRDFNKNTLIRQTDQM